MRFLFWLLALLSVFQTFIMMLGHHRLYSTPRDLGVSTADTNFVAKQVDTLISEYRKIVAESVEYQTASWFRYAGAYRVPDEPKAFSTTKTMKQQNRRRTTAVAPVLEDEAMIWDDERDIPKYFDRLISSCRKVHSDSFGENCLQFLHGLVNKARCTVRLDSRTTCRHHDGSLLGQVPVASILGPNQHFSADSINVVIIGSGPVGLYLANALTQIPALYRQAKSDDDDEGIFPPIRIVVFDDRLLSEGHKKPYSRLWMTGINIGERRTLSMDPRIHEFFSTLMTENEMVSLPINVWETILLLSCRDMGVKFVYGEIQEYEDYLVDVPNLVMFDATGHRLQPLQRGGDDSSTTIYGWENESSEFQQEVLWRWQFAPEWFQPFTDSKGREHSWLEIAQQESEAGSLLYPVLPYSYQPYYIHRFDFNNLEYDDASLKRLKSIFLKSRRRYQDEHGVKPPSHGEPVVDYNDDTYFRREVLKHIQRTTFAGIEVSGFSIKPTQQQGAFLEELLRKHIEPGDSSAIPWSRISVEEYKDNPVLKTNHVDDLLRIATRMSYKSDTPDEPGKAVTATAYRSKPYMYKDPIVPGGYSLAGGLRRVPLIRVGNSLFSGDTDISSGLEQQLKQIRTLQCKILHRWKSNYEDC